ncbi:unnamed protein product [Miscanthus lutarioriparius]|uniref:Disease resistance R13L4/SHOC-2-like LRR domain-containing protein n=1 Tax=Miscanthus lutarioriparius TaxID=422564 RepID=A0A811STL0_9POAL|nr:unnamed protein product [Miscanthus lutarioriparius]
MWTIPRGISKMKALRVLRRVTLGNDDSDAAQEVGELEQLQVFVVSLDDRKAIVDEDVLRNLALSLSKMCSLRWLWIGHRRSDDNNSKQKQVVNFLHHLPAPPRLLQTLWITGDVDGLPGWIGSLTHLVTFTILDTTLAGDQLFGILCKLPNLKSLYVTWTRHGDGSMSTLETLELRFDYRSTHATEWSIVGMEQLTNLKKVTLDGNKDNPALIHAVELLRADGSGGGRLSTRSKNNEFHVAVKYR